MRLAMPALRVLNRATGEAVHLDALRRRELTNLAKLESRHAIRVATNHRDEARAVHATSTGKSLLAWLPDEELLGVVDCCPLPRFTDRTITSAEALADELCHVRRNGFSQDREEFQPGLVCIGAPIRDCSGSVVAAVSCSLPRVRASDAHLTFICDQVKTAAASVSAQLCDPPILTYGNGHAGAPA